MPADWQELQKLALWATEHRFPFTRIKVGSVEMDFVPLMPEPLDNSDGKVQDRPEGVQGELPDPDGPLTDEVLFHSSGYESEPPEPPQEE